MSVHVSQHPLVRHKQTQLRDIKTDPAAFRALVRELAQLLFFEAAGDLRVEPASGADAAHQLFRRTRGRDGWIVALSCGPDWAWPARCWICCRPPKFGTSACTAIIKRSSR